MFKFVATILLLICSSVVLAFDHPKLDRSMTGEGITIDEEFSVFSRLSYHYWEDDFKWTWENRWRLIEYSQSEIKLISECSTAPDAFGGDLFQTWKFKALQPGTFDFIFELDDDQIVVSILVIP